MFSCHPLDVARLVSCIPICGNLLLIERDFYFLLNVLLQVCVGWLYVVHLGSARMILAKKIISEWRKAFWECHKVDGDVHRITTTQKYFFRKYFFSKIKIFSWVAQCAFNRLGR